MVFMIFFKWIAFSATGNDVKYSPTCAPSILNLFIDMMLFQDPEKENTQKCESDVCEKNPCSKFMFNGQKEVQFALITIALLCIPVLLLGKPIYIMMKQRSYHGVINNYNWKSIDQIEIFDNKNGCFLCVS